MSHLVNPGCWHDGRGAGCLSCKLQWGQPTQTQSSRRFWLELLTNRSHRLQLNQTQLSDDITLARSTSITTSTVVIDRELSLAAHVSSLCRSGYNQSRQLRPVIHWLSVHATRRSSRAAWTTATDCCTASTTGCAACSRSRTQLQIAGLGHQSLVGIAAGWSATAKPDISCF